MIHKLGDRVCPRYLDSRHEPFRHGVIVRPSEGRFDWIILWPNGNETEARDTRLILCDLIELRPVEEIPTKEWNLPEEWLHV